MEYSKRNITTSVITRQDSDIQYDEPYGLMAENEFDAKDTMKSDSHVLVPFHAVQVVTVTEEIVKAEKPNPRYCEPGEGGGACSAKVCFAKAGC